MAGDSPSPPRYGNRGNSSSGGGGSNGAAPPVNTNVRTLLIVGCILLVYLLISAPSDYDEYEYDNGPAVDGRGAAAVAGGGRIQRGPAPAPLIGPALNKARQPLTALKHKFRHLFDNTEYAGYGPSKPRVAVIIPDGDPHTVVGAVESVFR